MGASSVAAKSHRSIASPLSDIPAAVLQELQSRGCKLPGKKSNGVIIHGEFFRPGESDWAAVCFKNKSTSLLVFPYGSREQVAVLQETPRRSSHWSISVMDQEQLNSIRSISNGKGLPQSKIDHQGIQLFVESGDKDAGCLYC